MVFAQPDPPLPPMKKLIRIAAGLIVAHLVGSAFAQTAFAPDAGTGNLLQLQLSPYTRHNTYDAAHKNVVAVGLEREYPNGKLDGISLFTNSFGQPSTYIYPWGGVYRSIGGIQRLSFKWTAGLLYGYKEPYERKVPLNYKGFSPGAIVSVAYEFKPGWSGQINVLGTAALMFQLNVPLN